MNKIYYISLNNKRMVVVKIELTESINKTIIPGSKVTKKGIFTKSTDELFYLDKINYISKEYDKESLINLLSEVVDDDVVYAMSIEAKILIKDLMTSGDIPSDMFTKYTGVDSDFIELFVDELFRVDSFDYRELDYNSYFKSKLTLHPMIDSKQMFFYRDMPEGIYYTYSNKENAKKKDKDDDRIDIQKTKIVLGKKSNTNVYTVYKIKPMPIVDELYADFRKHNDGIDYYTIMLLDRVCSSKNIHYRNNNNLSYMKTPRRLESPTTDILISEILPAGVSYYAFEKFYELTKILNDFINNPNGLYRGMSVDITSMIFDEKYDMKHQSDFIINYNYKLNNKEYKIPVMSGLDMPSRNKLKSLFKTKPEVHLIIENINNVYCRYYTIVKSNDDYMLVGNYPANIVLLEDK